LEKPDALFSKKRLSLPCPGDISADAQTERWGDAWSGIDLLGNENLRPPAMGVRPMADDQAPMETEAEPATICVKREPDPGREGQPKEELLAERQCEREIDAANETSAQYLWNHRDDLFTLLRQPGPDATNWRAELAIRFGVILRKVCGGSRRGWGRERRGC
jgi:hypothetical protein